MASGHQAMLLLAATYRAFEAVGPTRCDHDRAALLLVPYCSKAGSLRPDIQSHRHNLFLIPPGFAACNQAFRDKGDRVIRQKIPLPDEKVNAMLMRVL